MVNFQDHWAKDCPHVKNIMQQSANVTESDGQQANDKGYEEDELILLAKELSSQLATVMTEFINFFSIKYFYSDGSFASKESGPLSHYNNST